MNIGCPNWLDQLADWAELMDWCEETLGYQALINRGTIGSQNQFEWEFLDNADAAAFYLRWR